jgi:NTP pyrophosphatase (non-canonical NTP hydrolase)
MNLNEYQKQTEKTVIYKHPIIYTTLGLTGEAGEVANIVKKYLRDGALNKEKLRDEIGDCLWYIARLAADLGFTLETIAKGNIEKLRKRYGTK